MIIQLIKFNFNAKEKLKVKYIYAACNMIKK